MSLSPTMGSGCQAIVVTDPCGQTNPRLVAAALHAGALGVLDLPDPDDANVERHIAAIIGASEQPFAVRLPYQRLSLTCLDLPDQVKVLIVTGPYGAPPPDLPPEPNRSDAPALLFEVVSREEARFALDHGAAGLIAKGNESGGRVGDVESFVLLQQIAQLDVPFWVQGGVAEHTAAAAVVGGAEGVVLDGQLALLQESQLPETTRRAVAAMDGSETRVIAGHRLYTRPDIPAASLLAPGTDTSYAEVAERLGNDIHHDLVPLGQDAATASDLAERHATVAGAVHAMREAITDHIASAARHEPLAPSPAPAPADREASARPARVLGTRYPVAQGPMTRVSDRPELALAVAEAGGHPFMALALLSGPDTRALLTATHELLGDRPWGVGILGFVPPEVRAAQLEVVQEIRPATALIAGGRPAHARPLEAAGIRTFLHVPSPGLLDHFLAEGARRFVFEGRECGGHVGPRASFPLWDAQVRRLLEVDDAGNLAVLFAGGIHDARSAAMVASVAAPLAARGAAIGVLMGTAYLFTQEAVATGAVTATFQDMARGCQRTALLETGPGHVTRCIESEYVHTFSTRKAELEADGVDPSEIWADLEAFNLGRLRVAAKGVTRQGKQIVPVDADEQQREGLYMIGQVATLRDQPTRIAGLHEEVTAGATAHLAEVADQATRAPQPEVVRQPSDTKRSSDRAGTRGKEIAVVGMAAVFPGAADTDQYWANILGGVDCISDVPRGRWDPDRFEDSTPSRWGGFLPWVPFDALRYGIPPRSLASIESVQLLSLEVAARALQDAGYGDRPFDRERASVIFGAEGGNELAHAYGFRAAYRHFLTDRPGPMPPQLDHHLPKLTEDSFPGVLTNVIAGRIANRLDLGGANYTVDAACAASLAALDNACKELVTGSSDMVLCGAADVHNSVHDYLLFASVHALSPTGRCRTFDSSADGIVLGEGVACVVLKRLADAQRDGDRVYAVIEGIGSASDGRQLGLTAPRQSGQVRTLSRAYERAGVPPSTVGLIEAHGTGTVVGDRTELAALTDVFSGDPETAGPQTIALGSVKSQIGHTKCAAGLAGLIKVARAIYTGVLPPTSNIDAPNGFYRPDASPFRFLDRPEPWPSQERRAGVSAFGFGGTNFHAALRSPDGGERPQHGIESWPAELFLIRAADAAAAERRLEDLRRAADRILAADPGGERHRLRDLAWTACSAGEGPVQFALVAEDFASLSASCVQAAGSAPRNEGGAEPPNTAFLYPGQGSQYPGMLGDLFTAFPRLQGALELDPRTAATLFEGRTFTGAESAARDKAVADTTVAQPALGLAALAVTQLLGDLGIRPDAVAGHSYGELPALASAGVFDRQALIRLSHARAQAMVSAVNAAGDPGAMAAVGLPGEELGARLEPEAGGDGLVVANLNAPGQSVVSGPTAQVEALVARLTTDGIGARRLAVSAAFHSPLMAGAAQAFTTELAHTRLQAPAVPVWSAASARPYPEGPEEARTLLADQLTQPVRFVEQIENMYAAGIRVFIEAGSGDVLTNLVGRILAGRPHLAVSCDPGRRGTGLRHLLEALAHLALAGVPVDARPLFAGRARALDLDELPLPAPGWRVNGHLVCGADGQPVEGGLQPVDRVATDQTELITEVTMEGSGERSTREHVVQEYLASMRDLASAQREVVLRYLDETQVELDLPKPEPSPEPLTRNNGRVARAGATQAALPSTTEAAGAGSDHDVGVQPPERPQNTWPRRDELMAAVLTVVSDRTGYPQDMLDPDLDLEADLSIDSIKRIEIVGELARRLELPGADGGGIDDMVIEELASLKTLRAVVSWLEQHGGSAADSSADEEASGTDLHKILFETVSLPPAAPGGSTAALAGQRLAVVSDPRPGLNELVRSLQAAGAQVQVLPVHRGAPSHALPDQVATRLGRIDGLIHLGAADPVAPTDARDVFAVLRPALAGHCTTFVAVTAAPDHGTSGPHHATGITGLMRTLARELPDRGFRVVELASTAFAESADGSGTAVRLLTGEIITAWQTQQVRQAQHEDTLGPLWVTYRDGSRATRQPGKTVPLGQGTPPLALGTDSVVVVTGGARGITATCALTLARATGCQLVLLGRSPLPTADEDAATATAPDRPALRRALVTQLAAGPETRQVTPAQVEAECDRILAAREMRATLGTLARLGTPADYHQVDVSDAAALAQTLEVVRERHGRIDAVIHGAGVIEDRLAADKSDASFDRVFATKVEGARTLLTHSGDDVRLVALFGSISGVYGNRGQADYSAANDALGELADRYDGIDGRRVVCIHWGPWAGVGMVTPELERSYGHQGIGLIPPEAGAAAFLQELATLPGEPSEVVIAPGSGEGSATTDGREDASLAGSRAESPPVTLADLTVPAPTDGPDTISTAGTADADRE